MKKFLILMLTVALLCVSVFTLASCNNGNTGNNTNDDQNNNDNNNNDNTNDDTDDKEEEVHVHKMTNWVTVTPATCTTDGQESRKCSDKDCNHVENRTVPALGHDLTHHEGKAATCTEIGHNAYDECSRCDYSTYEKIDIINHEYVGGVCTICSEPHDHQFGNWYTYGAGASCTDTGLEHRDCDGCDYTEERVSSKTSHTYDDEGKCTECGHVKSDAPDLPDHEL